ALNQPPTSRHSKASGSRAPCSKKLRPKPARLNSDDRPRRGPHHEISRNGNSCGLITSGKRSEWNVRAGASVAGLDRIALVVFRTQSGGTDGSHDAQKLLESHLKIEKAPLAENPAIIVKDLIRNHQWQAWHAGDNRKTARRIQMRQALIIRSGILVDHHARLPQGNDIALGGARH